MTSGHFEAGYATGLAVILQDSKAKQKGMEIIINLKNIKSLTENLKEIRQNIFEHLFVK